MGHATNIYGIISNPVGPKKDLVWTKNLKIIQSLPDEDSEYPWISNKMFSKEFQPGWDENHIHFAANYKNLEFKLQDWVSKFEGFLSRLMWLSVTVQIETETSGDFEISWNIHKDILDRWPDNEWISTTKWISEGLKKK